MDRALEYLNRFPMFGHPNGYKPGLKRVRALLRGLGSPHQQLPVVHIAGTNGKGSTATILASILQKAGIRTGLYTSPEIFSFTERIRIDGQDISPAGLEEAVNRIQPVVEDISSAAGFGEPTFFEVLTALAFWYFHHQQVGLLVMETGLGGRLDATNLCRSLVSIITNVTLEHTGILGHTLQEIAWEKAGIIKERQKVLSAARSQEVVEELMGRCQEMDSLLYLLDRQLFVEKISSSLDGQVFHCQGEGWAYKNLFLPLLGSHQLENAALAIGAAAFLQEHAYCIPEEALRQGLAAVRWPGRLEVISRRPAILIDGAHNPGGIKTLASFLRDDIHYERLYLLLGILQDKDADSIFRPLLPLANQVTLSRSHNPRAKDPFLLAEVARKYTSKLQVEPDFEKALKMMVALLGENDLLCISGSLYTMSLARRLLPKL